jgi:DNA polymerase
MVSDFSAIEAVGTSYLAGEDWKLDAFRIIQRGELYNGAEDIYCATAMLVLGRPVKKKNKKDRGIGKVCELAFGYQGGVNAWYNFDSSGTYTDKEIEHHKRAWRKNHPATVDLWAGLDTAAVDAVKLGRRTRYGYISYEVVNDEAGRWLTCILPNGRRLWYYNPSVEEVEFTYRFLNDDDEWDTRTRKKDQLSYEGRDNKRGGSWGVVRTYGGMLTENAVQAISRDIMVEAMIRVEKLGYPIVLTVHDEIIADVPIGQGSMTEFDAAMSVVPVWLPDCPVSAKGWEGGRYKKD